MAHFYPWKHQKDYETVFQGNSKGAAVYSSTPRSNYEQLLL